MFTYHEGSLLLVCLEATMSKFAGSIDKLEVDLFQGLPLGMS